MAYTEFDPKFNTLKIIREIVFSKEELLENKLDNHEHYSLLNEKDRNVGIKIANFLSKVELKGYRAETLFKELLDQIFIPYLHIGQSPGDHSWILQASKSKRPDFLINIPDLGILMIDVKCRRKMGFINNQDKYFQINKEEINQLYNLHHKLLLPVWIAFLDESEISHIHDKQKQKNIFYLASIVELKQYIDKLGANLSKREYAMISSVRVPYELLSEFCGEMNLKFGPDKISQSLIDKFAKGYKASFTGAETLILKHIRNNKCFKSKLSSELRIQYMLTNEVEQILAMLIQDKTVIHMPREFLKLKE